MDPFEPTLVPLLDPAVVAESQALMQEKYRTILNYFLEDSALYIEQIENAYASADAEALVPPSHILKSSSLHMGALRLSAAAGAIERNARDAIKTDGDLGAIAANVAELKDMLRATVAAYH